jgi:hypothetical protein
MIPIVFLI